MKKMKAFAEIWNQLGLAQGVEFKDSPPYPLARTVEMPEDHDYVTGALSFRVGDQKLLGLDSLRGVRVEEVDRDRVIVRMFFENVWLAARYVVEAKPDPVVGIDIAGNLMDLSEEARQPVAAGGDSISQPLDPTQEGWVTQANAQKAKLDDPGNPNGHKMVKTFHQYNDQYLIAFQKSSVQTTWQQGGVVKSMAKHTSDVDGTPNPVNPSDTKFGGLTYNENSFSQKTAIATAMAYMAYLKKGPNGEPLSDQEVQNLKDAAKAIVGFDGAVGSTGNSDSEVTPMNFGQVHTAVKSHSGDLDEVTDEHLNVYMPASPDEGGGEQDDSSSYMLSEKQRAVVERMHASLQKEDAANAAITGESLFEGCCEAHLRGVEAVVELAIDGRRSRAVSAEVVLPAFALDIDDSNWAGVAGETARERLEQMHFIRSLTHDSIVDGIQQVLLKAVPYTYRAVVESA